MAIPLTRSPVRGRIPAKVLSLGRPVLAGGAENRLQGFQALWGLAAGAALPGRTHLSGVVIGRGGGPGMGTSAGVLRHRVTLQSRIRSPRPAGGYDETWVEVWTRWGRLAPLRSREQDKWQSDRGEVEYILYLLGEVISDLDSSRYLVNGWVLQPIKMSTDHSGSFVYTEIGVRRQFEEEQDLDNNSILPQLSSGGLITSDGASLSALPVGSIGDFLSVVSEGELGWVPGSGMAGPAGPAGDPATLPQPLATHDSPQFFSLGVGTDSNISDGIALDVAGGSIRVSNPEGDEVVKQWSLLTRPYDTDKKDCAVFTTVSRAGAGDDSGVDLYIGGNNFGDSLPLNNIYFGTSGAYGTGSTPTRFFIDYLGNVVFGGVNLPTDSVSRFLYISGGAGAPTGVPSATYAGRCPLYYDYTNSILYVYNNLAWRPVGAGTEVVLPSTCDARLTLTQGVAVTTSDVVDASTLYLTRYQGSHVALWDGSAWVLHEIPSGDVSLALSGLTDGKVYDVFLHDNAGTLTLSLSAAWADGTTRTDALAYQDGVRVLASDHTKRLVGTFVATGTDTTEDSGGTEDFSKQRRYLCNERHKVPRRAVVESPWSPYTYSSDVWRVAGNTSSVYVSALCGSGVPVGGCIGGLQEDGSYWVLALGLDGATTPDTAQYVPCIGNYRGMLTAPLAYPVTEGLHEFRLLEKASTGTQIKASTFWLDLLFYV